MIRTVDLAAGRMDRIRKGEPEKGFTLIELLVVVIIIGILAAIAIPAFLNQRASAWRASVESDSYNANLAIQTWLSGHNGTLPTGLASGTGSVAGIVYYNASTDVTVTYTPVAASSTDYTLVSYNSNIATQTYTFTTTAGKGVWGAAG